MPEACPSQPPPSFTKILPPAALLFRRTSPDTREQSFQARIELVQLVVRQKIAHKKLHKALRDIGDSAPGHQITICQTAVFSQAQKAICEDPTARNHPGTTVAICRASRRTRPDLKFSLGTHEAYAQPCQGRDGSNPLARSNQIND